MKRRFLFICGIVAPWWFVLLTLLGGALRPGYNHLTDTISELFSPGSPNKPFLDILHTIFALLLILFGIGLLSYFQSRKALKWIGQAGAILFILMGCVSVATAAVYHQDPWGTPVTFAGEMHEKLSGVVGLLSMLSMALIGIWFVRTKRSPRLGMYSFITIGVVVIATGFLVASIGGPFMGLAERIAALTGFQWTFTLACWMVRKSTSTT